MDADDSTRGVPGTGTRGGPYKNVPKGHMYAVLLKIASLYKKLVEDAQNAVGLSLVIHSFVLSVVGIYCLSSGLRSFTRNSLLVEALANPGVVLGFAFTLVGVLTFYQKLNPLYVVLYGGILVWASLAEPSWLSEMTAIEQAVLTLGVALGLCLSVLQTWIYYDLRRGKRLIRREQAKLKGSHET